MGGQRADRDEVGLRRDVGRMGPRPVPRRRAGRSRQGQGSPRSDPQGRSCAVGGRPARQVQSVRCGSRTGRGPLRRRHRRPGSRAGEQPPAVTGAGHSGRGRHVSTPCAGAVHAGSWRSRPGEVDPESVRLPGASCRVHPGDRAPRLTTGAEPSAVPDPAGPERLRAVAHRERRLGPVRRPQTEGEVAQGRTGHHRVLPRGFDDARERRSQRQHEDGAGHLRAGPQSRRPRWTRRGWKCRGSRPRRRRDRQVRQPRQGLHRPTQGRRHDPTQRWGTAGAVAGLVRDRHP
ncbi:Uncharacterised protein [Mycobacteroides abscessus subsp. abscessus]|nr:Uncharacterised protein [Mycobacteroides abscessus subsp. abscessus]